MLELYFTKQEMIDYLVKQGYTIEKIKTWTSGNVYHNQVENYYKDLDIAYTEKPIFRKEVSDAYNYYQVDKFSVENQFRFLMKEKLLNL